MENIYDINKAGIYIIKNLGGKTWNSIYLNNMNFLDK